MAAVGMFTQQHPQQRQGLSVSALSPSGSPLMSPPPLLEMSGSSGVEFSAHQTKMSPAAAAGGSRPVETVAAFGAQFGGGGGGLFAGGPANQSGVSQAAGISLWPSFSAPRPPPTAARGSLREPAMLSAARPGLAARAADANLQHGSEAAAHDASWLQAASSALPQSEMTPTAWPGWWPPGEAGFWPLQQPFFPASALGSPSPPVPGGGLWPAASLPFATQTHNPSLSVSHGGEVSAPAVPLLRATAASTSVHPQHTNNDSIITRPAWNN